MNSNSITNYKIPSATSIAVAEKDQQRNLDDRDRMRHFIDFYLGINLIKSLPSKINISEKVNRRLIN
jgi:hypothetical protein